MRLKKKEREFFRKFLENFIVKNPQFKQVVDHVVREGIARRTEVIGLEVIGSDRPSSWR